MGLFIGIDPGAGGAIAVLDETSVVEIMKLDRSMRVWHAFLSRMIAPHPLRSIYAVIEQVNAHPSNATRSAFAFGRNYGGCQMLVESLNLQYLYVLPRRWQKELGCTIKGEEKGDRKRRMKAFASELFPDVSVTHANADALLIAQWCRQFIGRVTP